MLIVASILLVPAAVGVGVLRQWRFCLSSLGLLYLLLAVVEGLASGPVLAGSQLVTGAAALAVVYLAPRRIFPHPPAPTMRGPLPAWEYFCEGAVAALGAGGAALFARAHPPFALSGPITFSWVWLSLAGLFMVVLAANVREITLGVLVFDAGLNLLLLSTAAAGSWPALLLVQLLPIALALLLSGIGIRLSQTSPGVQPDPVQEARSFGPVRVPVREGQASAEARRSARV